MELTSHQCLRKRKESDEEEEKFQVWAKIAVVLFLSDLELGSNQKGQKGAPGYPGATSEKISHACIKPCLGECKGTCWRLRCEEYNIGDSP
ncbi:uncharacterized [Tachysurus ichikawai]